MLSYTYSLVNCTCFFLLMNEDALKYTFLATINFSVHVTDYMIWRKKPTVFGTHSPHLNEALISCVAYKKSWYRRVYIHSYLKYHLNWYHTLTHMHTLNKHLHKMNYHCKNWDVIITQAQCD